MKPVDHYAVLGVPRGASLDTIKTAHRALARKYHPDLYAGADAQERSAAINVAWDVLSDAKSRRKLDTLLHTSTFLCARCNGTGSTLKQKGFGKKVPERCPDCAGTGVGAQS